MTSGFDALFAEPERPDEPVINFVGRKLGDCIIEEIIADQPASQVYIAEDTVLERKVAVKLLKQGYWLPADASNRFRSEGRILAKIRHPSVVQIYGFHELDGLPCLVMEYVPDGTLSGYLDVQATPIEVARLLLRVTRGVASAHRLGIVHRDIKPQNILIDKSVREPALATFAGIVKVTDFGIAKVLQDFEAVTRTGMQPGTILHMAPEQIDSRYGEIGPATDVFSLGALLYRVVSGEFPFQAESVPQTLKNITSLELSDLISFDERTPTWLNEIFLKCTQKIAVDRFQNAEELAAAFELHLQENDASAEVPSSQEPRRTSVGFVIFCLAIVLLLVSTIWRGWR